MTSHCPALLTISADPMAAGYGRRLMISTQDGPSVLSFEVVAPSSPINQHDDVTFSCETDSQPMPVISLIGASGDTLVSSSTSNTLEHTLTDIDCLDSGPPRKYITSDTRVAAAEGETVTFSISVVAFPESTFTWNKRYEGHFTDSRSTIWYSLHVCVSYSIIIPHITKSDFGNYSVTVSNGLGVMEDVIFSLIAAGKPDLSSKLRVHHDNAVSITIQWTSGWSRGGEQVFTLMYRRSGNHESYANITDNTDPGQGETVSRKALGLLPDTSYDFIVLATNQFGGMQSALITASSATEPQLVNAGSLSVNISGVRAFIKWHLHSYKRAITHVEVNGCDNSSARCLITAVLNITSAVEVAVPEGGSSYTFVFKVYDGEDLLLNADHIIKLDTSTGLVVGVVVAVVLLCAVAAIIGFIVWRRRRSVIRGDIDRNIGSNVPLYLGFRKMLHVLQPIL